MKSLALCGGLLLVGCGSAQAPEGSETAPARPETGTSPVPTTQSAGGAAPGGGAAAIGGSPNATQSAAPSPAPIGGAAGSEAGSSPSVEEAPPIGPDGFPLECLAEPPLPEDAQGQSKVELSLQLGDAPLVFGEVNSLPMGASFLPTNLRFYLSQFELTMGGAPVAATPVSALGTPLPYGVQLVNAAEPESLSFQLAAPAGDYDGISFLVGLSEGCNSIFGPLRPPLDEASQMKWPHVLGFLFLRLEGSLDAKNALNLPELIHMGRAAGENGFAPRFELPAPVSVGQAGAPLALEVDIAAALDAASMETDLSDFQVPPPAPPVIGKEIYAGERLRRNSQRVHLFRVE